MNSSKMEKIKKTYNFVQDGLKKVQAKPWAGPLGQALGVTGDIVSALGDVVPGLGFVGGALSFGATLLNPDTSEEDAREFREALKKQADENSAMSKLILEKLNDLEIKEVRRDDMNAVQEEMMLVLKSIQNEIPKFSRGIKEIKDVVDITLDMVTDLRYRVSKV